MSLPSIRTSPQFWSVLSSSGTSRRLVNSGLPFFPPCRERLSDGWLQLPPPLFSSSLLVSVRSSSTLSSSHHVRLETFSRSRFFPFHFCPSRALVRLPRRVPLSPVLLPQRHLRSNVSRHPSHARHRSFSPLCSFRGASRVSQLIASFVNCLPCRYANSSARIALNRLAEL
jgi:hypothetical protein